MKSDSLNQLIKQTRRVYQSHTADEPYPLPAGFANRVVQGIGSPLAEKLIVWQWTSFVGLGVAAAIALMLNWRMDEPKPLSTGATDPWMEMPMSADFKP